MSFPVRVAIGLVAVVLIGGGVSFVAVPALQNWLRGASTEPGLPETEKSVELVAGKEDTIRVKPEVMEALGVQTAEVRPAGRVRSLSLSGSLGLDTNHLARVQTLFSGVVIEIGTVPDPDAASRGSNSTGKRQLDLGDKVEKGQLLAVLWSKDLGEKKSELVTAVATLKVDDENLKRMMAVESSLPERAIREAERTVDQDRIAVARARRTLRSWGLPEPEIKAIEDEWVKVRKGQEDPELEKRWARVEIRAPFAGTILERNITLGTNINDITLDLFKIADLGQLRVWANIYEDDLPALEALPRPIGWSIGLNGNPKAKPVEGKVDQIGHIVDPNDHTARVVGRVPNVEGTLRAGQFITATIDLPPIPGEVEVPTTALVGAGRDTFVFVQPDKTAPEFTLRRVAVVRRLQDVVFIRSSSRQAKKGEEIAAAEPLRPGERVVSSGAVELKSALEDVKK